MGQLFNGSWAGKRERIDADIRSHTEMADAIIRRRGHLHPYAEFDPAATLLLVVDMQNNFVSEDERTGYGPARNLKRCTLPVWVLGSAATNSTARGYL